MRLTAWRKIAAVLLIAGIVGGSWGIYLWRHYPAVPDARTASVPELIRFTASDDFNRMYGWHRQQFAGQLVERVRQMSLPQIILLSTDRSPANVAALHNLRQLPNYDEISAQIVRLFLDKFYHESKWTREAYMWVFAMNQKLMGDNRPPHDGMPDAEGMKKDMQSEMSRLMTHQPPQTVAEVAQFLLDLKQKRKMLGMPDKI